MNLKNLLLRLWCKHEWKFEETRQAGYVVNKENKEVPIYEMPEFRYCTKCHKIKKLIN